MIPRNRGHFIKGVHYSPKTEFKKEQTYHSPKPYWFKPWLEEEYLSKRKSAKQIADEQNCDENNILYFLKKLQIPTRKMRDIRKNKYWGSIGEDNPMYNMKGELSPNWRGGSTPERQTFYSSIEWKKICGIVWARDKATCHRCGIKSNQGIPMHIHHIVSFINKNHRAEESNLILLCEICHHWVHSRKNTNDEYLNFSEEVVT